MVVLPLPIYPAVAAIDFNNSIFQGCTNFILLMNLVLWMMTLSITHSWEMKQCMKNSDACAVGKKLFRGSAGELWYGTGAPQQSHKT